MNACAAAKMNDNATYTTIKNHIMILTGTQTVVDALEKGLVRTETSNDYPAWALAKFRVAAAQLNDDSVYEVITSNLISSIQNAKDHEQKAEYILAELTNQSANTFKKDKSIFCFNPMLS